MTKQVVRPLSKTKFRVDRAARDLAATLEILREESRLHGYCGPPIAVVERAVAAVAALQEELRLWGPRLCGLID